MKLCKDCKHAALPNYPYGVVTTPMCAHSSAERSVVDGSLMTSCIAARGTWVFGATDKSVCWPDAKLFEERPPVVEVEPSAPVIKPIPTRRISFIDRIVDRLFFR